MSLPLDLTSSRTFGTGSINDEEKYASGFKEGKEVNEF